MDNKSNGVPEHYFSYNLMIHGLQIPPRNGRSFGYVLQRTMLCYDGEQKHEQKYIINCPREDACWTPIDNVIMLSDS